MFFTKIILNTSLVINNELIDLKYKSLISSIINSGNGLGGMFYVLMYYLLEDWRYAFIVSVCITTVCGITIHIFYHESLAHLLIKKDYKKFYETLLYIAKKNNREKEFEEGINKNDEYKNCIERLKGYTLSDKKEIELEKQEDSKNEINKEVKLGIIDKKNIKSDELLKIKDNSSQRNLQQKQENPDIFNDKKIIDIKSSKKIKGNFFKLFKYSSVRYTAIILSIGWFCNAALFYGLVIGIKTLKGSQYRNTAILYLCDFFAI